MKLFHHGHVVRLGASSMSKHRAGSGGEVSILKNEGRGTGGVLRGFILPLRLNGIKPVGSGLLFPIRCEPWWKHIVGDRPAKLGVSKPKTYQMAGRGLVVFVTIPTVKHREVIKEENVAGLQVKLGLVLLGDCRNTVKGMHLGFGQVGNAHGVGTRLGAKSFGVHAAKHAAVVGNEDPGKVVAGSCAGSGGKLLVDACLRAGCKSYVWTGQSAVVRVLTTSGSFAWRYLKANSALLR